MLLDYDDQFMYVAVIQQGGRWVHLQPGSQLEVAFGVSDRGYFRFPTSVIAEVNLPAPALKIPYPGNLDRLQQRRFFRLETQLPLSFRVITDLKSHQSLITYAAHTLDLSAGGLQLQAPERIVEGDLLEVDLLLGNQTQVSLVASVRRATQQFDGTYQVAIEFTQLEPKQENLIIRWVFQEQARRRRLGLR
jgi:c-di-GMP-binding flagellar brake protein YcgR